MIVFHVQIQKTSGEFIHTVLVTKNRDLAFRCKTELNVFFSMMGYNQVAMVVEKKVELYG